MKFSTEYTKNLKPCQVREFVKENMSCDVVAMAMEEHGEIDVAVTNGEKVATMFAFDYFIDSPTINKQVMRNLTIKWQKYLTKIYGKEYSKYLEVKEEMER